MQNTQNRCGTTVFTGDSQDKPGGLPPEALALRGSGGTSGRVRPALGVYGLLAVPVAQQSKELGIRMAMGADPRGLLLDVMRRGARFASLGCAMGVLLAFAASRWVGPLLYSIRPLDPVTYAAVPCLLMATVLLASLLPARRAVRVDPTVLLKDE